MRYPENWVKLSYIIKKRRGGRCELCGDSDFIVVHHIDRNHFNCSGDNLIVLCACCHDVAHYGITILKQHKKSIKRKDLR